MHKHHLKPKHRGGTDADGLVEVSPTRHAMFHFCEWQLHRHQGDYLAWRALSGQISAEEISEEKQRMMTEKSANWHRGRKRSAETCERISKAKKGRTSGRKGIKHTEETKALISQKLRKSDEEKAVAKEARRLRYKDRKNELERERYRLKKLSK